MSPSRGLFVLALGVSLALFLLPVTPSGAPGSDKVGHLLVFGLLAVSGRAAALAPVPLAVGLAAYAVLTEVLQAILPLGRYGDPADALADLVGVALGLAAWEAGRRLARLRRGRAAAPSPSRPRG